ncbi:hypothetical protein FB567DRAFT_9820 [Paraphoma chrysanthemicola]|uniref:Uncharacterized protein n=1 Tax=Paraphoma chrysanthemicola TaxID=798071 RepID=A0A8K0RJ19_9PLEO|nr:hypothetical protein FB567DRAFT_9820 [Paraphoma chrysanthemicola]
MKLTLAFLAALAAADAAEARSHRQARRQYGSGYETNPYGSGGYGSGASSAKPVETPLPSSVAVPYVQSSAEAFVTSYPPDAASSYPPVVETPYPSPEVPEVPEGGKSTPAAAESTPYSPPVETPAETPYPAESSAVKPSYGAGYPEETPKVPEGAVPSSSYIPTGVLPSSAVVPSGAYPSSAAVPSGAVPSGGYESPAVPEAASSTPYGTGVYPSGGAGYPTGTGVSPASSTPLSDLITKTIYSTSVYGSVTSVVAVGTTCVEKDSEKTPSPSAPVKITSEYPVSEVTKTTTETLVYTVGVGSTAHPVTTEVVKTSTSTVYSTVIITASKPAGDKPVYGEGYPEGPTGTSTIKSTTTSTKYITVKPTPSSSGKVPSVGEQGYPVASGSKAGAEDCAVPVTVTVTAKETVYVTKGQDKPNATPLPSKPAGEYPASPVKPSGGADVPKGSATPSPLYPIGNGTHPYPAGPTGFKTSTKPAYPVGTGAYGSNVPTKPSETSSLPYFSFVSEVPYPTPSAVKTPSVDTEVPYPSSSPAPAESSPAAEYGSGYGEVPAPSSAKPVETPYETPKVPSKGEATPTPTPAVDYGNGYGTY